jgi:hypothetical protein
VTASSVSSCTTRRRATTSFPSRVELLDAVLAEALQAHIEVAERALAMEDPWEGFCFYLEETCRLQATDRGLNDAMGMRFPRTPALEAARGRLFDLGGQLIAHAQQAGQLRPTSPTRTSPWSPGPMPASRRRSGPPAPPDAWRRHLGFLLDGFRADRATPLPEAPLSPRQVYRAMLVLGRRSAGITGQYQR